MRILVLTSTFPRWPEDTEPRFVYDLCLQLSEHHRVEVLAPHTAGSECTEQVGPLNVRRFRYCLPRWQQLAYGGGMLPNIREKPLRLLLVPLFLLFQTIATARLLRREHYDVIHAHWIIPQGLTAVIARLFSRHKPPIVLTSHGGDLFALKGRLLSRLKHWVCARADHLSVVSSAMRDKAAAIGLKALNDISVIPMGTDTQGHFLPPPSADGRRDIVFVGRLVDKKGVEYLIQAMPTVLANYPDCKLSIIGDGPLRETLEALSDELALKGNIHFLGSQPNSQLPAYLQAAAVTVFPSVVADTGDQEGTPVAIMEALACACACVVCDYPGVRDIIIENNTGLLAAQRSLQEIAQQILRLLDEPELARTLGDNGRKHVMARYDWRVVESQFSAVFRQLGAR
ncbi:MAG: glycosyltransferase family 4 protein [Parahaliea sp.]